MEDAVKLLVTRYIPLTSDDMEAWMADPEEWVNAEESEEDHWEYELRVRDEIIYEFETHSSYCSYSNVPNAFL